MSDDDIVTRDASIPARERAGIEMRGWISSINDVRNTRAQHDTAILRPLNEAVDAIEDLALRLWPDVEYTNSQNGAGPPEPGLVQVEVRSVSALNPRGRLGVALYLRVHEDGHPVVEIDVPLRAGPAVMRALHAHITYWEEDARRAAQA